MAKTYKTASEQMCFYFFETLSKLAQGKYTEAELQEKREALQNGDFSAAKVLVDAAIQKGIENSNDE